MALTKPTKGRLWITSRGGCAAMAAYFLGTWPGARKCLPHIANPPQGGRSCAHGAVTTTGVMLSTMQKNQINLYARS